MRLTVIAYHHVTEKESDIISRLYISQLKLRQHLQFLIKLGIPIISTFAELEQSRRINSDAIMLTFDDAYENFYTLAFPILKEFNVSAVLFVPTAKIGLSIFEHDYGRHQTYVTSSQLQELKESGLVNIQPHGHSHVPLADLNKEAQKKELKLNFDYWNEHFESPPIFFCLPYGSKDRTTYELLREFGVRYAFTTKDGDNSISEAATTPCTSLKRYAFKSSMTTDDLQGVLLNPGTILYPNDVDGQQSPS